MSSVNGADGKKGKRRMIAFAMIAFHVLGAISSIHAVMTTRTEQGELWFALHAGHGEFPRALLAPAGVEEAFWLTVPAGTPGVTHRALRGAFSGLAVGVPSGPCTTITGPLRI